MNGFKKLLAFEALVKTDWFVAKERDTPRLDLVHGGRIPGQALSLHDDPFVRRQIEQQRDAYGYRKIEGKGPDEERRTSEEEKTYFAAMQVLRSAKDRSQAAWFHKDAEVQYYGPHLFEVCNRSPRTLEKAKEDLNELRNIAHEMEGNSNENVRSFGRQMAEIATGLPGIESKGRTGYSSLED